MMFMKHFGLFLKLDYENAYDRIDWDFLDDMLHSRKFSPKFRSLIKYFFIMVLFV
jgi:hypothetical protein